MQSSRPEFTSFMSIPAMERCSNFTVCKHHMISTAEHGTTFCLSMLALWAWVIGRSSCVVPDAIDVKVIMLYPSNWVGQCCRSLTAVQEPLWTAYDHACLSIIHSLSKGMAQTCQITSQQTCEGN